MPVLEIVGESGIERLLELSTSQTLIGRDRRKCQVVFDDSGVSRIHARIKTIGEQFILKDCDSRNGTTVNGRKIATGWPLADGDEVGIDRHRLLFRADDPHPLLDRPSSIGGVFPTQSPTNVRPGVRASEKLKAIMAISSSLSRSLDLDSLLNRLLETLFQVFPNAECGAILLPRKDGELIVRTWKSSARNEADAPRGVASRTIARQVMTSGESLLCVDTADDTGLSSSQSIADADIRSVMCSPMKGSDGTSLGVIHLDRRNILQPFVMDDLELLACVAMISGQTVENNLLHEEHLKAQLQEQELQLAADLQRTLLPSSVPEIAGYEIAHHYQPANELGGDYFDHFELPDGRYVVAIGDVAGKGTAAALLVASLFASVRAVLTFESQPAKAVERLNGTLADVVKTGRFITFLLAIVDPETHTLTMTSAGHVAPLLCRDGKILDPLGDQFGCPLGIDTGLPFEEVTFQLQPEDIFLLITDGVTEARNSANELFGTNRVEDALCKSPKSAESVIATVLDSVASFVDHDRQDDDTCLVALRRI
ncbi:MAG: SpoIIE family protein phosphatase [Planctomycetales bacterium]|jgi:sigma-B regulation protein RsbU (phosphoserine phosphatase)